MITREMYVVMVRDRGLFIVQPNPSLDQQAAVEAALGLKAGYSSGLVALELPEGATRAWIAWVEGGGAAGIPYFEFRAYDSALSEAEVVQRLAAQGEEPLKLNQTEIYQP